MHLINIGARDLESQARILKLGHQIVNHVSKNVG